MNKIILMGRLTKDPDIRATQTGSTIARYTLAVDRRFKKEGEPEADFINCIVFGKGAEFAERYLHKGIKIAATGRLQTGSYTNKDGQRVNTADVVIEEQEFAESKAQNAQNARESREETQPDVYSGSVGEGFEAIPDGVEAEGLPWN